MSAPGVGRLRQGLRRLRRSAVPILQCALAAAAAWLVATVVVGHPLPFFAPIAAVVSLGISQGTRLRRAAELIVGVSIGIAVGDLLIAAIGTGAWQLALIVALAMAVAVLLHGGPVIVVQAGTSGVLLATLVPNAGVPRALDALVGGIVGLAVAALLAPNPLSGPRQNLRAVLGELAVALERTAGALRRRDSLAATDALIRLRGSQRLVDDLRASVQAGTEITRISPLWWRRRERLAAHTAASDRVDFALRNVRVLARRALAMLDDDEEVDASIPALLTTLAAAVRLLHDEVGSHGGPVIARAALLEAAGACADERLAGLGFSGRVVVAQVRSVLVDLLQATGMNRDEANAALPPVLT